MIVFAKAEYKYSNIITRNYRIAIDKWNVTITNNDDNYNDHKELASFDFNLIMTVFPGIKWTELNYIQGKYL